ncbi:biotin/lipoate--protein ligase family protein [Pinisolibacter sp.]|uniref:biotin/lipoate--protein ligase family protein n=1 Tax=Pinisolibacter sp. TaxID=2172024 RepID=UPI002FDC7FF7
MSSAPILPPVLTGHPAPPDVDPLRVALEGAASGRLGAGDLVWSRSTDVAAAAIVLEPDVPWRDVLEIVPVMLLAVGDALGSIGPPDLPLMVRWPETLTANGGAVGRVTIDATAPTGLDDIPDHAVVGFSVTLELPEHLRDAPGHEVGVTALHEEGCGDVVSDALIGATARHFLSWLDEWRHGGFARLKPALAGRLLDVGGPQARVDLGGAMCEGRILGFDDRGGARIETAGGIREISLARALGVDA